MGRRVGVGTRLTAEVDRAFGKVQLRSRVLRIHAHAADGIDREVRPVGRQWQRAHASEEVGMVLEAIPALHRTERKPLVLILAGGRHPPGVDNHPADRIDFSRSWRRLRWRGVLPVVSIRDPQEAVAATWAPAWAGSTAMPQTGSSVEDGGDAIASEGNWLYRSGLRWKRSKQRSEQKKNVCPRYSVRAGAVARSICMPQTGSSV